MTILTDTPENHESLLSDISSRTIIYTSSTILSSRSTNGTPDDTVGELAVKVAQDVINGVRSIGSFGYQTWSQYINSPPSSDGFSKSYLGTSPIDTKATYSWNDGWVRFFLKKN